MSLTVRSFKRDDINKSCILLSDEHTCLITTSYNGAKAKKIGLDSCIVLNGEKLTLNLIWTMPNVELYCKKGKVSNSLTHYISVHVHRHTDNKTAGHEYSIAAQLLLKRI